MSAEKTYLVRRSDATERKYLLHELTWLWRSGELPHDAVFRDDVGLWKPVSELVEPILESQRQAEKVKGACVSAPSRSPKWRWVMVAFGVAISGTVAWEYLEPRYSVWKTTRVEERKSLERERKARTEDFIKSNYVTPGMTVEEVRRAIGEPRSIEGTADQGLQRWLYRAQVVVFEDGKVVGVEARR